MSTEITSLVASITWSGSDSEAARKVSLSVVSSATDLSLPQVNIRNGNMISLVLDKTVFEGFVFSRTKSYYGTEYEVIAYDGLIYLLKSKASYNINRMSPELFVAKICSDHKIQVGMLAHTGILINQIFDSKSLFEIIKEAYEIASLQNGIKYKILFIDNKLEVIPYGYKTIELGTVFDIEFSESIESMVNKIHVYDSMYNSIGEAGNNEHIRLYGTISDSYIIQDDINSNIAVKNLLQGPEVSVSISLPGDINCVTGNKVIIKDEYTGIEGAFYIASDSHTWTQSGHVMALTLSMTEVI